MAKHERHNIFNGITASTGIAIGTTYVRKFDQEMVIPRTLISIDSIEDEMQRLKDAQKLVAEELELVRDKIEKNLGKSYSEIISAQLAILRDNEIFQEVYG